MMELESAEGVENLHGFGDHLFADAVARDDHHAFGQRGDSIVCVRRV
jgi:hypothetical protein